MSLTLMKNCLCPSIRLSIYLSICPSISSLCSSDAAPTPLSPLSLICSQLLVNSLLTSRRLPGEIALNKWDAANSTWSWLLYLNLIITFFLKRKERWMDYLCPLLNIYLQCKKKNGYIPPSSGTQTLMRVIILPPLSSWIKSWTGGPLVPDNHGSGERHL